MAYASIRPTTTVSVPDFKNLMAAWREHGGPFSLVGRFVLEKPLTDAQFRRLPKALQVLIEYSRDGEIEWLRALWNLPDTRD